MQLTQNAQTYQTRAHWALCPHITDFLRTAKRNWFLRFCSLSGPTDLFPDRRMRAGTPALLGYCISLYRNCCMHNSVEHNSREWETVQEKSKKCSYSRSDLTTQIQGRGLFFDWFAVIKLIVIYKMYMYYQLKSLDSAWIHLEHPLFRGTDAVVSISWAMGSYSWVYYSTRITFLLWRVT